VRLYAGQPLDTLIADLGVQWAVERGLQLCAQNALDIATHLAASAGREAADYATAIDVLPVIRPPGARQAPETRQATTPRA
jgi:hypothetical protein